MEHVFSWPSNCLSEQDAWREAAGKRKLLFTVAACFTQLREIQQRKGTRQSQGESRGDLCKSTGERRWMLLTAWLGISFHRLPSKTGKSLHLQSCVPQVSILEEIKDKSLAPWGCPFPACRLISPSISWIHLSFPASAKQIPIHSCLLLIALSLM